MSESRLARLLVSQPVVALRALTVPGAAHLVGGCVRDALLGVETEDLDVAVACDGEALARTISEDSDARYVPLGGRRFAAHRVVASNFTLDIWDRTDNSLDDELARRDLTINAIAVDIGSGALIDRHRGLYDLAQRTLRSIDAQRFVEDPLRVLRLARFAAQLPFFRAEHVTIDGARSVAASVTRVATERIREELRLLLSASHAAPGIELMGRVGLAFLLSEKSHTDRLERVTVSMRRFDSRAAWIGGRGVTVPLEALIAGRWALIAHRVNDDEARRNLTRLRASGLITRRTEQAAATIAALLPPRSSAEMRWLLHTAGSHWPAAVASVNADIRDTESWRQLALSLIEAAQLHGEEIFTPAALLHGDEVARRLGLEPGPDLGRILDFVRREQIAGRVKTQDEAWRLVAAIRPPARSSD